MMNKKAKIKDWIWWILICIIGTLLILGLMILISGKTVSEFFKFGGGDTIEKDERGFNPFSDLPERKDVIPSPPPLPT